MTATRDSQEQAIADSKLQVFDYKIGEYRQFFTSPFEQYAEHVGKRFTAIKRLRDAERGSAAGRSEGEDMHLIKFEDGTEIQAWGHECCVLIYERCK